MRISLFRHFLTIFDTFLHYQYAQVHTRELIRTCDIPSASKALAFPGGEGGCHRQTDEGNRNVRTIISSSTTSWSPFPAGEGSLSFIPSLSRNLFCVKKAAKRRLFGVFHYKTAFRNCFVLGFCGLSKIWDGVPCSAITPSSIKITRVPTSRAKPIS